MDRARVWATVVLSAAALLVAVSLAAAVRTLAFDGDLVGMLRSDSLAQDRFAHLESAFQPFSSDEVLLLEADDLSRPDRFDALREIVIELQLVPGVAGALSVFSLPDPADGRPLLADAAGADAGPLLDRLDAALPEAARLIARDRSMTLVVLMPQDRAGLTPAARDEVLAVLDDFGGGAVTATFVGLPEAYRHLQSALLQDQLRLIPFAVLASVLVAGLLFRSWRAAVLCVVPPLAALAMFMGVLAGLGLRINSLISLVPLLILVLGIANMLHFYLALRDGMQTAPGAPIRHATRVIVLPCTLSGLTTAIAFASFALTGFGAMEEMALAGVAGLAVQTVTVLVLGPSLAVLLGLRKRPPAPPPGWLSAPVGPALWLCRRRRAVIGTALAALTVSAAGHLSVTPGHSMDEHLLRGGAVAQAEARMAERLSGTGQRFLVLADPDGLRGLTDADLAALAPAIAAFADLGAALPEGAALAALRDAAAGDMPPVLRRFVSADGLHYAVPLTTPLVQPAGSSLAEAQALEARIAAAGLEGHAHVTGLSHLASLEIPRMIDALKQGMVVTILLVSGVVAVAARSLWLGFGALVVNVVPVLGVEALFWAADRPLTMTAAVALTIAFGVAVDDSLHMLNRYRIERARDPKQAVARSLGLVGVPIAASTLLIVACLGVTQASLLPSVATFGMIVCVAMLLAYLADMFLLPAFLSDPERARR